MPQVPHTRSSGSGEVRDYHKECETRTRFPELNFGRVFCALCLIFSLGGEGYRPPCVVTDLPDSSACSSVPTKDKMALTDKHNEALEHVSTHTRA